MVSHLSAIVFPAIIIYSVVPGSSLFSWHPTLMSIAFSLLTLEGIIIFSQNSSLFPNMSRASKASIHYLVMGSAVTCALVGFYVIYLNKENAGKSHLTSWHGFLGAITVGYACLQSTGGSLAKYYNYTKRFLNVKLADLKLYHATSAVLLYILITVTMLLSLQTSWALNSIPNLLWYACFACICTSTLVVLLHITSTYLPSKQQAKP
ncbi:cytochrome b561 domain-containing protein 2 [Biomphalaria glabrata]|nr:cytochrome b561 domain-containing protein 2 [Biomphalaria glabrata]